MLVLWSLPASKIIYMAFFFFVLAVNKTSRYKGLPRQFELKKSALEQAGCSQQTI